MKYLLIVNPNSGPRKFSAAFVQRAVDTIRSAGHSVEAQLTERAGHAYELAREALEEDYDVIVACGGDGTVNEIGEALKGTSKVLGILPRGSGNGLARELRIPMAPDKALEVLLRNDQMSIDTCEANGESFFITCGIGFDGKVSDDFASSARRGIANYVADSVNSYFGYEPSDFLLNIDGREKSARAFLVAVANASQYGNNAFIAPNASMRDGLLDVTIIKDFPKAEGGKVAYQLFSGDLADNEYTKMYQGKEITITTNEPVQYHIDGEPRGAVTKLTVKVIPHNLTVCIGREEDREKNVFDLFNGIADSFQKFGDDVKEFFNPNPNLKK